MKTIQGYENYSVTEDGQVWSNITNRFLKPQNHVKGYKRVRLSCNTVWKNHFVHRLVAEAYLPNLENKQQVNHKDMNKHNNNVHNLEWVTNGENQKHAYKNNGDDRRIKNGKAHKGKKWSDESIAKRTASRKANKEFKQQALQLKEEHGAFALQLPA